MGMREDLRRFREVGEERREDLAEFITYGDLGASRPGTVRIPIKLVDLPEFEYDKPDMGGLGQTDGEVEPGDPVEQPTDDGAAGEPGEDPGDHGYHEMDPEAFAEALDEELGLDLEPKGKTVIEEELADFSDVRRSGPRGLLDVDHLFRRGLKRKLMTEFDEDFLAEVLRVEGVGPDAAFRWARANHVPVSKQWLREAYAAIPAEERTKWRSIAEVEANVERTPVVRRIREAGLGRLPFRRDDERYRYPTVREQRLYDVVVVNIRDVSGSMREAKRELVERTFAPLDWYLQGKYDRAEFVYIAHDATAWEVDRDSFFGIRSGGGTRISSAYELAAEILEAEYPWSEWNRYVFAAGDSENATSDTEERVIPLMESIDANRHAYVETQPGGGAPNASHADEVADHFADAAAVSVAYVAEPGDVIGAIRDILEPAEAT